MLGRTLRIRIHENKDENGYSAKAEVAKTMRLELEAMSCRNPESFGCRNVRCCEETGHKPGVCAGVVATKFWTFRWKYYCAPHREYGWYRSKSRGYTTVR